MRTIQSPSYARGVRRSAGAWASERAPDASLDAALDAAVVSVLHEPLRTYRGQIGQARLPSQMKNPANGALTSRGDGLSPPTSSRDRESFASVTDEVWSQTSCAVDSVCRLTVPCPTGRRHTPLCGCAGVGGRARRHRPRVHFARRTCGPATPLQFAGSRARPATAQKFSVGVARFFRRCSRRFHRHAGERVASVEHHDDSAGTVGLGDRLRAFPVNGIVSPRSVPH